jgi:hypothetical protein
MSDNTFLPSVCIYSHPAGQGVRTSAYSHCAQYTVYHTEYMRVLCSAVYSRSGCVRLSQLCYVVAEVTVGKRVLNRVN